ncbi:hypothetical protein Pd630_LPD13103 (plasmid) [Rhodococcus opacus PD630]|nr:hypothetical protein Pd630_LPD13103 [Rhodococcus opacus PD630]
MSVPRTAGPVVVTDRRGRGRGRRRELRLTSGAAPRRGHPPQWEAASSVGGRERA